MDRILRQVQHWLTSLLIFLIPTNLALHLLPDSAEVFGITIDYLIPKLYVSDLVIAALFGAWLLETRLKLVSALKQWLHQHQSIFILSLFLLASLLVSIQQSDYPIAGYWFLSRLLEMVWLSWYLIRRLELARIKKTLLLTLLFQSGIGIIQWIQKQSLLGYWFLGETTLRTNSYIAKTGITGEIRPLPYGTTPHPNVLAGFLTVGLLILLLLSQEASSKKLRATSLKMRGLKIFLNLCLVSPILLVLLLTQSVSAGVALLVGVFFLHFRRIHWVNSLAVVAMLLAGGLAISPYIESTSVTRRIKLAEISWLMIQAEPWLGVGLNNFTARMTDFGQVISTTRFLQPVHNIYLLWISETGLVSTGLLGIILGKLSKQVPLFSSKQRAFSPYIIPLLGIAIIGLADHYPLSLQTGQLLTALSLAIGFGKKTGSERHKASNMS